MHVGDNHWSGKQIFLTIPLPALGSLQFDYGLFSIRPAAGGYVNLPDSFYAKASPLQKIAMAAAGPIFDAMAAFGITTANLALRQKLSVKDALAKALKQHGSCSSFECNVASDLLTNLVPKNVNDGAKIAVNLKDIMKNYKTKNNHIPEKL